MSSPPCKLKSQNAVKVGRRANYATREEHAARKHHTPLPYFRLEDSLCKSFLEIAKDPCEFEGIKLLFPFVREMSVLRFPRTQCSLSNWMQLAFMSGHDLGRAYPDRIEDVLPGHELRDAERRVGVLRGASGEERCSSDALARAFDVVIKANWAEVPQDQLEAVILDASLRTLRTGYAAATVSRLDPTLFEFVADVPERIGECISDITVRLLVGAPRNAAGKPVGELLEHPLLAMAREKHPGQPVQCEAMLHFLRSQLRALAAKSENDCPMDEVAMLDWIGGGFQYGAWLKEEHPRLVDKIFDECKPQNLTGARSVVRQIVERAGGIDPARLLPQLKLWQKGVYGSDGPKFYGEALARIIYFVDFAVWIPLCLVKEV
jgi:hypothetical protein